MTDRAELREKVARALYEAEGGTKWDILGEGKRDDYRYMADAAIAVALQEAARVARAVGDDAVSKFAPAEHRGYMLATAMDCAAAIRAMIGKTDASA